MPATDTPLLHSIEDAQRMLGGLGRTTVYELNNRREIVFVKVGRRSFVTDESLRAYVARLSAMEATDAHD